MNKTNFTKLPVGTKVWSFRKGWGELTEVNLRNSKYYQVRCFFANDNTRSFSASGHYSESEKLPELFLNEFEIPDEAYKQPLPDLEIDTKVLVRANPGHRWAHRYFKKFDSRGFLVAFREGATSWSSEGSVEIAWEYWKLP